MDEMRGFQRDYERSHYKIASHLSHMGAVSCNRIE